LTGFRASDTVAAFMLAVPQLTIDLAALQANYRLLRDKAKPAEAGAGIKANGYGLGTAAIATALHEAGCNTFFAAHFSEVLHARKAVAGVTIACMHGVTESEGAEALAHTITPVLNSLGAIEDWAKLARTKATKLPAFIHLDTGMNRLGLPPDEQERLIADPHRLDGIEIKAWISHLACSEEFDNPMTTVQRDRFKSLLRHLPPAPASLCNSSGIFWGKDYVFDLVRPGVALYGVNPTPQKPNPMQGVIELKAPILQIREAEAPMTIGYDATHRVTGKTRIATLALGYADGYPRSLSGKGQVKIGDCLAPVVGRVSMDLLTVDVGGVPETVAHPGAMAIVIGAHRPVDTVAAEAGTIGYEILTGLGARFQRRYLPMGRA
jgi:alanine racemase